MGGWLMFITRVLESIHKCDMGGWLMFITRVLESIHKCDMGGWLMFITRVLESIHKCDMGGWLMFITVVFWNQFISVIWVVGWCLSPLCSGINHHYFFMNNWKSGLDPSVWFLITTHSNTTFHCPNFDLFRDWMKVDIKWFDMNLLSECTHFITTVNRYWWY